jgi:hypothetical protein
MHQPNALGPVIGHRNLFKKHPEKTENPKLQKHESPELRGFHASWDIFCFRILKTGTPPAISLTGDSIHHPFRGPWYRQAGDSPLYTGRRSPRDAPTLLGSLVQAGRGFPLYSGPTPTAKSTFLGTLIQAGQGFPLLHRRPGFGVN